MYFLTVSVNGSGTELAPPLWKKLKKDSSCFLKNEIFLSSFILSGGFVLSYILIIASFSNILCIMFLLSFPEVYTSIKFIT